MIAKNSFCGTGRQSSKKLIYIVYVFVVRLFLFFCCCYIILYVNCFGRTMLCVCTECHIWVDMYHVSAQGVDEHMISVHYYYYYKY